MLSLSTKTIANTHSLIRQKLDISTASSWLAWLQSAA
jgi:hypothetical protein